MPFNRDNRAPLFLSQLEWPSSPDGLWDLAIEGVPDIRNLIEVSITWRKLRTVEIAMLHGRCVLLSQGDQATVKVGI